VQTPTEAENAQKETVDAPIRGELRRVNSGARTFVIVLENGMEQTFRFNDFTQVSGDLSHVVVDPRTVGKKKISGPVQGLIGREGAYVTVEWSGGPHDKTATLVVVGDQN
jgi:hypothetical protein